jgi:DNA-binding MarR family transcriptional regulator
VPHPPPTRDRRQVMIRLTSRSERLLARLSAAHRAELERLAPLLQTLLAHFRRGGKSAG